MWNADLVGYNGSTNFIRAYLGDELVWEKPENAKYFRIESLLDNSTVKLNRREEHFITLEYSRNAINWYDFTTSTPTFILNNGDKLYVRGTSLIAWLSIQGTNFSMTGKLAVKGKIGYLGNYLNPNAGATYQELFKNCTGLYDASELELGSSMYPYIYKETFSGCTSLINPPKIYDVGLATNCYNRMFSGCTALKSVEIFRIYLTVDNACLYMFDGCVNLNKIITHATKVTTNALNNWVRNVSLTGDFYNLGGAIYTRGTSGIPTGWTVQNV